MKKIIKNSLVTAIASLSLLSSTGLVGAATPNTVFTNISEKSNKNTTTWDTFEPYIKYRHYDYFVKGLLFANGVVDHNLTSESTHIDFQINPNSFFKTFTITDVSNPENQLTSTLDNSKDFNLQYDTPNFFIPGKLYQMNGVNDKGNVAPVMVLLPTI